MFTLAILHLVIATNTVSFLTPAFTYSEFNCYNEEMRINQGIDFTATGHNYWKPQGNFTCNLYIYGSGYIYPSERDFISLQIVL